MQQVTGIVIGDAQRLFQRRRPYNPQRVEKHGDVHRPGRQSLGTGQVVAASEHQWVIVKARSAAGGGRHDGVNRQIAIAADVKRIQVAAGECDRARRVADVPGERPTADLRRRYDHFHAIARQYRDRCGIDLRRQDLLRAAGQQRYPRAPRSNRPGQRWQCRGGRQPWRQQFQHRSQPGRRQRLQPAGCAAQPQRPSHSAGVGQGSGPQPTP